MRNVLFITYLKSTQYGYTATESPLVKGAKGVVKNLLKDVLVEMRNGGKEVSYLEIL